MSEPIKYLTDPTSPTEVLDITWNPQDEWDERNSTIVLIEWQNGVVALEFIDDGAGVAHFEVSHVDPKGDYTAIGVRGQEHERHLLYGFATDNPPIRMAVAGNGAVHTVDCWIDPIVPEVVEGGEAGDNAAGSDPQSTP